MDKLTNNRINLHKRSFEMIIPPKKITGRIRQLANEIDHDYQNKSPLFIGILNGVFMFAGELMKHLTIPSQITFMRIKSYESMNSTGSNQIILGLEETIKDKHIILLEDIIDTGNTLSKLIRELEQKHPASIEIATLLLKPKALRHDLKPKFVGFEIENSFVIGYGMDYDGFGRNIPGIYQLSENNE